MPNWSKIERDPDVDQLVAELSFLLPTDKDARILDIGFGRAWFLAACIRLGYRNLEGADFGASGRQGIRDWSPSVRAIHKIDSSISDFLSDRTETYDFIHMSHVIEHIPKYSLFHTVDSLYNSLRRNGTLLLRTPNMEGPCALSSYYVTMTHEYGFCGSNLRSLLELCNFDDVRLHSLPPARKSLKQRFGVLARNSYLKFHAWKHRLFGVNAGGKFGSELVITGRRLDRPPLLSEQTR